MKKIFSILSVLFCLSSAHALEGVISYGGDPALLEFHQTAKDILDDVRKIPNGLVPYDNLANRLAENVKLLDVTLVSSPLLWNGQVVTAVNIPSPGKIKILLAKESWNAIQDRELRHKLVLHELLPSLMIDDRKYEASGLLYNIYTAIKNKSVTDAIYIFILSSPKNLESFSANANWFFKTLDRSEFDLIRFVVNLKRYSPSFLPEQSAQLENIYLSAIRDFNITLSERETLRQTLKIFENSDSQLERDLYDKSLFLLNQTENNSEFPI